MVSFCADLGAKLKRRFPDWPAPAEGVLLPARAFPDSLERNFFLRFSIEEFSQRTDGRILKKLNNRELGVKSFAELGMSLKSQQGMAARIREVVVPANLRNVEQFLPNDCDLFFDLRFQRDKGHRRSAPSCGRDRQCFAIHFAIGSQWQPV